ncbi:COX15/CtaA family protein [Ohtaekwangia koreensis]|uniref:Cytochrome c oxidase assembly protein subunit 15 n=1 Tax=Ohtaekwangia koreensis TaxID=688867 RepID=A0A1T5MDI6_9BACT|nr:COX15/CtaA family protein [Ohtaekwangia koreensis]SKC86296.1 cytochrome c oxidase assembly protein subunit 15 [Ohtaekwangia koreensis]
MRSFRRLTISTLIAVYLLILVGGIVRSTGSGMGCPDWPKCFGSWTPPQSVSELPSNYKEIYAAYRQKKNIRFAKYLNALGMEDTAQKLLQDPSVLQENDFNPTKTWIEYINRIVGVIIGFLIFLVFVSSVRFWNTERRLTVISLLTFILVGFQGWIGSFVVSTNLTPWTVTVHMFLALLIVAMLIYLWHRSSYSTMINSPLGFWWLLVCIAVLLVQTLLGTQVREAIDRVATWASREIWTANLGVEFILHRSFSWIVLVLHVGLILNLRKTEGSKAFLLVLIMLILGTILTGTGMAYFGVPPYLQPLHLLFATTTFGAQFLLLLKLNRKEESVVTN